MNTNLLEWLQTNLNINKAVLFKYGWIFLKAIILLTVGIYIIKVLTKLIKKLFQRSKIDHSLQNFLSDLIKWMLIAGLIISVLNEVGVATTSFVAILGAAGLAIGLALQGALTNFAGATMIMIFKPFKIGDLIEADGQLGTVKKIEIFVTKILTPENKLTIIPNGILSNTIIKNYTAEGKIRIDLNIGVDYESNLSEVKTILTEMMLSEPNVLLKPLPTVAVQELGNYAISIAIRPWAKPEDYWDVYFNVLEKAQKTLKKNNIKIPYPKQVIEIKNKD